MLLGKLNYLSLKVEFLDRGLSQRFRSNTTSDSPLDKSQWKD